MLDDLRALETTAEVPAGLKGYVKVAISASARLVDSAAQRLYDACRSAPATGVEAAVVLVPYFSRAHRPSAAMRVWMPKASPEAAQRGAAEDASARRASLTAPLGGAAS